MKRSRSTRVVLISPGIIKYTDVDFGLPHLVAIGSYLQSRLPVDVSIIDLGYESAGPKEFLKAIEDHSPMVIGISCYSSFDYIRVLNLGNLLKGAYPDIPIVVGGYHVSALPDDFIYDGSPFDVAVVGEGEIPMRQVVESLLSGNVIEKSILGPMTLEADKLPSYDWTLLGRYLGDADRIGRKFQIYLSRGCPHHCTFCMERSKGEYKWQPFSAERAIEEMARLSRVIDLKQWIINISDPLFGFKPRWRRDVLEGLIRKRLIPRYYWALTRAEGLEEVDVELFAKANFAIGIGFESASHQMLQVMQKTRHPEDYLDAFCRVSTWSRSHKMNFGANLIIGHPGETFDSMKQTAAFVKRFVSSGDTLRGWLSFDPFRLYPGSMVHQTMSSYEREHGTVFHQPTWWRYWSETSFRAEYVNPSRELTYLQRVRFMYDSYHTVVKEISARFRGPGNDVDRVFQKSIDSQLALLEPQIGLSLEQRARERDRRNNKEKPSDASRYSLPIGFRVRDPWIRLREQAVGRLIDNGMIHSERVIETLLTIEIESLIGKDEARAVLRSKSGLGLYGVVLEMMQIDQGERLLNLSPTQRYLEALLGSLCESVSFTKRDPTQYYPQYGKFDAVWFGLALPMLPRSLLDYLRPRSGSRMACIIGPRFGRQEMTLLTRSGKGYREKVFSRFRGSIARGRAGWLVR